MKKTKAASLIFIIALIMCPGSLIHTQAADYALSAKKSFDIAILNKDGTDNYNDQDLYFEVQHTKTGKLKKNMSISCTIYVPVSALKKNNEFILLDPSLVLCTKKNGQLQYTGRIVGKYGLQLQYDAHQRKVVLWKHAQDVVTGVGKYGSFTRKGNYYVVKMKNIPLMNKYFTDNPDNMKKINTKKAYYLLSNLRVFRMGKSEWTGTFYIDNLQLKSTSTQKVTFNKKDYADIGAFNFGKDGNMKVKVKKVPG